MLLGSVFTGFISYYLNSYYSGNLLKYTIWQQIKDVLPSFGVAAFMAVAIYPISLTSLSPFVQLTLQLIVGAIIVFVLCELIKLEEYKELKGIAISLKKKLYNNN